MDGKRRYAAFLFDMDGTIINSIAVAERVWGAWARGFGLDVEAFLPTIHGVRAVETIRRLALPGVDPQHEADEITRAELADLDGIEPIAGALAFLGALPPDRWAIVTSSPRELALRRIASVGIVAPNIIVAAEDVSRGKPAPDCFRLAARQLDVDAGHCLVFEDAPAGILAAEAAGADVVVISATHAHPMETRHRVLENYIGATVRADGDGLTLLLRP